MQSLNSKPIDALESAYMADVKRQSGWFAQRFESRPNRVCVACVVCCRPMWLPQCKVGRYKTCGGDCARKKFEPAKTARERACETCGKRFVPRLTQLRIGQGRFCTHNCSLPAVMPLLQSDEAKRKSKTTMAKMRAVGLIKYRIGSSHHSWTGGKEAQKIRVKPKMKEYVKRNADKVKAWSHNRRVKKLSLGRLPAHTVEKLRVLQKGKCAICKTNLGKGIHCQLDHIVPVARNGRNEFHNVQLLCLPCNQHKSAKIPHVFMQSMGYLL